MQSFLELSNNVSEKTYLTAANQLGIPIRTIDGANRYWLLGKSPGILLRGSTLGLNSATLMQFLSDKAASQSHLSDQGIPVPQFLYHHVADNWDACFEQFSQFSASRYPVVIKPNAGRQATGVYTDIRNLEEMNQILLRMKKRNFRSLILEQHVSGITYRGIVLDDELIDVIQWDLSTITGDGQSTVHELLNALNATDPGYRELRIGVRLKEILHKHELNLSSTPDIGHRVKIVDAGIYRGARRQRISLKDIPKENNQLLSRISQLLGARLIGIDFICEDATKPWTSQDFHVNEVNSSPGFGLHYPGTNENDMNTVKQILQRICVE